MFMKVGLFFAFLGLVTSQTDLTHWDLAVALSGQIELLHANGSVLGSVSNGNMSKLKAVAFDHEEQQFVTSNVDDKNFDSIYIVSSSKEADIIPIVENLPDDVQGLAIDSDTDILYWTDSSKKTITTKSLKSLKESNSVLFQFNNESENPQDVVIDACNGFLYWTNSNSRKPSIERSTLRGKDRKVLIDDDLFHPVGITIDQQNKRIYWTDTRQGIYYHIESSKLDGSDRRQVHRGIYQRPFGIAVIGSFVYWTDPDNKALYKKNITGDDEPERVRQFDMQPMGLIARHFGAANCTKEEDMAKVLNETKKEHITNRNEFQDNPEPRKCTPCLNGGVNKSDCTCECQKGYSGEACEITLCHNYCYNGNCKITQEGTPVCNCPSGFNGTRCERKICDGFCFSGGTCNFVGDQPKCKCPLGFDGSRCEIPSILCEKLCQFSDGNEVINVDGSVICSCTQSTSIYIAKLQNVTKAQLISSENNVSPYFEDPIFIVLYVLLIMTLVICGTLTMVILKIKRNRPRIKKRIVVNKNITPLTYRAPAPTEQCEITIENCCNMNVCETPCFEPPAFRTSKKDEKKTLLANMENGDDLY